MRYFLLFLAMTIIVLALTFSALNAELVKINYYFATASFHLPVLLFITFTLGLVLGVAIMALKLLRLKTQLRHCKKTTANHIKELDNLRTIPIKD